MTQIITEGVWLVGGSHLSHPDDCLVYALDLGDLVLIDCGAGPGWPRIRDALLELERDPASVHTLVLTHAHVDHIGATAAVVRDSGCRVAAHDLDADAIESGDPDLTAASWYGVTLPRVQVTTRVTGDEAVLRFSEGELRLVHTPGHTPGSLVAFADLRGGERVVFAQDVHGPFSPSFRSDLAAWRRSMDRLLALEATILCEGHLGVFRPAAAVRRFIESQLRANREI